MSGGATLRAVALVLGAALLSSCSTGDPGVGTSPVAAAAGTASETAAAPVPVPEVVSPSPSPPESGGRSGPAQTTDPTVTRPRSSAGPLDAATVPAPAELGPGWVSRVEGADIEAGPGNGTPHQERDPAEIVQTTVPLGCIQRTESAVPSYVLQSTYRHRENRAYAVVLRMRFDSAGQARQFLRARHHDLAACRRQPDDPYSGAPAPVLSARWAADRSVARYRLLGEHVAWFTSARVEGSDVLTIDADPRPAQLIAWRALGFLAP